jgi:hypothetical protein
MSAALALGQMGKAANAAVPAMEEALLALKGSEMSAEDIQVARNLCYALGDIGPDAKQAIPALRTVQHLRTKYIAEAAIAKIEGEAMPNWH